MNTKTVSSRFQWNFAHLGALLMALALSLTAYAVDLGKRSTESDDLIVADAMQVPVAQSRAAQSKHLN